MFNKNRVHGSVALSFRMLYILYIIVLYICTLSFLGSLWVWKHLLISIIHISYFNPDPHASWTSMGVSMQHFQNSCVITVWHAVAQVRIPVEANPHYFYYNNIRLNVFTTS